MDQLPLEVLKRILEYVPGSLLRFATIDRCFHQLVEQLLFEHLHLPSNRLELFARYLRAKTPETRLSLAKSVKTLTLEPGHEYDAVYFDSEAGEWIEVAPPAELEVSPDSVTAIAQLLKAVSPVFLTMDLDRAAETHWNASQRFALALDTKRLRYFNFRESCDDVKLEQVWQDLTLRSMLTLEQLTLNVYFRTPTLLKTNNTRTHPSFTKLKNMTLCMTNGGSYDRTGPFAIPTILLTSMPALVTLSIEGLGTPETTVLLENCGESLISLRIDSWRTNDIDVPIARLCSKLECLSWRDAFAILLMYDAHLDSDASLDLETEASLEKMLYPQTIRSIHLTCGNTQTFATFAHLLEDENNFPFLKDLDFGWVERDLLYVHLRALEKVCKERDISFSWSLGCE